MELKQVSWVRVLVEGVVIVGSILLAFAIDAAWDQRQERREQRELYETLWTDIEALAAQARDIRDDHKLYLDAAAELLTVLEVGQPVPTDPRTDTLMARSLFNFRTFDGSGAGLQFALDNAHLVENDSLLTLLQAVPTLIVDLREDEDLVMTEVVTNYWNHVGSLTEASPYLSIDIYRLSQIEGSRPVPSEAERRPWAPDTKLINLVHGRLRLEQGAYGPAIRLVRQLGRIRDVLAEELGH